jgi:hypothetical protein
MRPGSRCLPSPDGLFNADDRAAQLNGGAYRAIPLSIRRQVNLEFEAFVREKTTDRQSFALKQPSAAAWPDLRQ